MRTSPAAPRRTIVAIAALVVMAIAATSISAGLAATPSARAHGTTSPRRHASPSARAHDTASIGFSHAVIVDQQRPGNEPDVKVAPNGSIFTSEPFGFSTTQSFLWSSLDKGNSYQFVPGTIGPGKPATCAGGGDTDLLIDPGNALYFSDLQGLTNITNSKSTDGGATFTTNCAGAPNAPVDREWFTGTGSSAGGDLTLYQDYDAVNGSSTGGNQLVETVSHDGTTFTPVVNTDPVGSNCVGTGAYNCVTNNEGISGNQVVDPSTGNVFIAHTTANNAGVQVSEGKITPGTPTTATWTESPNLDQALCADLTCTDAASNPEEHAGENFASIARDSAGYLYVTFTAGALNHTAGDANIGAQTGPEQVYVVHSLQPAGADPSTLTWSAPVKITGSGASAGTNVFPWITAGSDGRIDIAWYHTPSTSESGTCVSGSGTCTLYGAGSLTKAEWNVQMGQSLNAHAASPAFSTADVTEAPIKYGQICTNGLGCATGGDRSLGDFLQVSTDAQGAALVSYVNDTSNDTAAGENAGPEQISRQLSGPSLFASAGTVSQNGGPGLAMGSVSDPSGDAFYSANGSRTPAGDNLDLTGASLANGVGRTLVGRINVKSLSNLTVSPSLGGPDASWLIRWSVVTPGETGNGHIYYIGMDNNATGSGTPTFFAGDTVGIPANTPAEHTKYLAYPQTHVLSASQASYDKSTGVITLNVPLTDVGNPADGTRLLSATAFSATSTTAQSAATLFNLTDATTPFELIIGAPGTGGAGSGGGTGFGSGSGSGSGGSTTSGHGRCAAATGRLSGRGLGRLTLGMTRARARKLYPRWSTRNYRYTDFYCARPIGLRGGYPTPAMLRPFSKRARGRQQGKLVLILSANHRYALHGVRPGSPLRKVARRLHVGRRYGVGSNSWYLIPNGASHGVLKVRHGVILEVGVASRALTSNRARDRSFFHTLRSL